MIKTYEVTDVVTTDSQVGRLAAVDADGLQLSIEASSDWLHSFKVGDTVTCTLRQSEGVELLLNRQR